MTDAASPPPSPAALEEITEALAFALRHDGRKRVHNADDMMARITAERLLRHLARSGFVVMKQPAAVAPSTSNVPPPTA